jgi:hypothetical protein
MPVRVAVHIDAPIDRVFEVVSDHEAFLHIEGETTTKVVRDGAMERNGLGCIREVNAGPRVRYVEEITAWDRPSGFAYTIRETSLPLRHLGSRLAFTPSGRGTDVEWTADFEMTVPIVGRLLRRWVDRRLERAFTKMLVAAKSRLERRTPPT